MTKELFPYSMTKELEKRKYRYSTVQVLLYIHVNTESNIKRAENIITTKINDVSREMK